MNSTKILKSIIVALLLILGLKFYYDNTKTTNNSNLCIDYSNYKPSTLQTGLVGDMVTTYRVNQLSVMNSNMNNNETRSITFDLDTIAKFIYHIKKGVEKNSSNLQNEKLGLRIYYAAYPDISKWGGNGYKDLKGFKKNKTTRKYEKKLTLVMLPIRKNSRNEIVDFNPFDASTYLDGLPKYRTPLMDYGKGDVTSKIDNRPVAQQMIMAITIDNPDNTVARNHGTIYPPGLPDNSSFD